MVENSLPFFIGHTFRNLLKKVDESKLGIKLVKKLRILQNHLSITTINILSRHFSQEVGDLKEIERGIIKRKGKQHHGRIYYLILLEESSCLPSVCIMIAMRFMILIDLQPPYPQNCFLFSNMNILKVFVIFDKFSELCA